MRQTRKTETTHETRKVGVGLTDSLVRFRVSWAIAEARVERSDRIAVGLMALAAF